ncbi:MAG: class I SAM-dependent methyltransferase [Myxococcota bacterium]
MSSGTLNLTPQLREYLLRVGVREDSVLAELRAETARLPDAQMQISPEQGALMRVLVQLIGAKSVLELGTFTGYSSVVMARALPDDGRITCCDRSTEWTSIARRYWEAAGVAHKVELRLGPALDTLDALKAEGRSFDLAFVDADKENLPAYHERMLELVRSGGAILYDNVLWSGQVIDDADQRPGTVAIRALNELVAGDDRVEVAMIPIGDGLTLLRKR